MDSICLKCSVWGWHVPKQGASALTAVSHCHTRCLLPLPRPSTTCNMWMSVSQWLLSLTADIWMNCFNEWTRGWFLMISCCLLIQCDTEIIIKMAVKIIILSFNTRLRFMKCYIFWKISGIQIQKYKVQKDNWKKYFLLKSDIMILRTHQQAIMKNMWCYFVKIM